MNFVVVPPPQMAANLKAGNLDGYCVGEPWNSLAVIQRDGWIAQLSLAIAPRHPEKVLLVRSDFVESRTDEHQRLIASFGRLHVRFDHPEPFIYPPRNLSKQIGCIRIIQIVRLVNRQAHLVAEVC